MFLKKSEHKHLHPYFTLAVGAFAFLGVVSTVKCVKGMISCGCDKMSSVIKDVMHKSKTEDCD